MKIGTKVKKRTQRLLFVFLAGQTVLLSGGSAFAGVANYCKPNTLGGITTSCRDPGLKCGQPGGTCTFSRGFFGVGSCACLGQRDPKTGDPKRGRLTVGTWGCTPSGPLAQNASTVFNLVHGIDDHIEAIDLADIADDGTVLRSQILSDPSDLQGTFELDVGNGPPEAIPVTIADLNLTVGSMLFEGKPSGPNVIVLGLGASDAVGTYNSVQGTILFEGGIPATAFNDIFPNGIDILLGPWMNVTEGVCEFNPTSVLVLPFVVPTTNTRVMVAMMLLALIVGTFILSRKRIGASR